MDTTIQNKVNAKSYCRLCLKLTNKNQMVCLGNFHDLNYPSRSDQFKRNKILQTQMYVRMINVLMPEFDHDIVFNPVMCNACSTRLQLASDFMETCMTTQKIIKKYLKHFKPSQTMVSCDEVAQNRPKIYVASNNLKRKPGETFKVFIPPKLTKVIDTDVQVFPETNSEKSDIKINIEDIKTETENTLLTIDHPSEIKIEELSACVKEEITTSNESDDFISAIKTEPILITNVPVDMNELTADSSNISTDFNNKSISVQYCQTVPLQLVQQSSFTYINFVDPLSMGNANINLPHGINREGWGK